MAEEQKKMQFDELSSTHTETKVSSDRVQSRRPAKNPFQVE